MRNRNFFITTLGTELKYTLTRWLDLWRENFLSSTIAGQKEGFKFTSHVGPSYYIALGFDSLSIFLGSLSLSLPQSKTLTVLSSY
jgi:hypothetical protein